MSNSNDPAPKPRQPKLRQPKLRQPERKPPARGDWPVVRALVPVADAFLVSGYGTAGIVRRQPDGLLACAFFFLNLSNGGIELVFGKDDASEADVEFTLSEGTGDLPPFEEGPAELAARYVLGARAWGDGVREFTDDLKPFFSLLPKIPGGKRRQLQQLVNGERPLAHPGLLLAIEDLISPPPDPPDGREPIVATFVWFEVPDLAALRAELRCRPDEFALCGEPGAYEWIRPRKRHPEQRVPHGLLALSENGGGAPGEALAHTATLSHASQMVMRLRELTGGTARVIDADWDDVSQLRFVGPGMTFLPS
jgi:hypothetical protein